MKDSHIPQPSMGFGSFKLSRITTSLNYGLRLIYISGPRLRLWASAHQCDWASAQLYQLSGCFAPIKGSQLPQLSAHLYFWASAPLVGFGSSIGLGLGSACASYGLLCSNQGFPLPSSMGGGSSDYMSGPRLRLWASAHQ